MLYQHQNSIGQNFYECIRYENFYYVPHMHRHPELIYVHTGEVIVKTNEQQEYIRQGEFALILPNQIHEYITPEHSLVDVCIFSQDYAPLFFKEIRGARADRTRFLCRPLILDYLIGELFVTDHTPDFYLPLRLPLES